ncbi:MAG TPA: hypothetical protein VEG39_05545 [Clostridia bacterium]|nr:hypothetical protein [Clostridia bacterium]
MNRDYHMVSFALVIALFFSICLLTPYADYEVQYGYAAEALWEDSLFLGSGSSFELDKPLTRSAGAARILLRI